MSKAIGDCENSHWCRTTKGDKVKATFTWTIEDYINRPEKRGNEGFLNSSVIFVHGPDDKTSELRFLLYPRGDGDTETNEATIFMKNLSDFDVKAEFEVSVRDVNMQHQLTNTCSYDTYKTGRRWGIDMNINLDHVKANPSLLTHGKHLTLVFNISLFGEEKNLYGSNHSVYEGLPVKCKTQVADDYVKIFAEDQFSDVLVECDGQAFKCHQVILSARSPVFMAMFQAGMKESKTKSVTIRDYNPEVVKEMLHFIYTGSLTDEISEEMAKDLLRAANQYHLDLLKGVCEEKLCSTLALGNSLEYLVLGDLHHASNLKAKALILVVTNMTDIVNTEDYKNFHKNHPDLALEMTLARFKKDEKEGGEKGTETERTNGN